MDSFSLDFHWDKCRLCFVKLNQRQNHVQITTDIENKFYELTQLNLKYSTNYSDQICIKCGKELTKSVQYKRSLAGKQSQLYEFYPVEDEKRAKPEFEIIEVNIKQEIKTDDDNKDAIRFKENVESLRESLIDQMEPELKLEDPVDGMLVGEPPKKRPRMMKDLVGATVAAVIAEKSKPSTTKKKHGPKGVCPECGVTGTKDYIRKHLRKKHYAVDKFFCDICGRGSQQHHEIKQHMMRHISIDLRKKFQCSICGFTCINAPYMKAHEASHDPNAKEFKCHCGKTFVNSGKLATHQHIFHDRRYEANCDICSKTFNTKAGLSLHKLAVHIKKDIRDISCELCPSKFALEPRLKRHMIEMHSEGKLRCTFEGCGRLFHKQGRLKLHEQSHTKERPFPCDKCPAAFRESFQLKNHIRSAHLGIRVQCQIVGCQQTYTNKKSYLVHLQKHHKEIDDSEARKMIRKAVFVEGYAPRGW